MGQNGVERNGIEGDWEATVEEDVLDEEEVARLVAALERTHGPDAVTEQMVTRAVDWARAVRRLSVALALVLAGEMDLRVQPDGQISFELNELGEAEGDLEA
jgi:hypothetical protein